MGSVVALTLLSKLVELVLSMKGGAYAKLLPPELLVALVSTQPATIVSCAQELLPMLPMLAPPALNALACALSPDSAGGLPKAAHTAGTLCRRHCLDRILLSMLAYASPGTCVGCYLRQYQRPTRWFGVS